MTHPVKGVDHVFLLVDDLDASRDAFARLGFTISPRGLHSAHKGAANHTIMFPDDYAELLGLIAETPGNADRRAKLAREGQGLHAVACRIENAAEAQTALAEAGIETTDLGGFSRPVPLPDGSEVMASFDTLQFAAKEVPLGTCFMCQHKTREAVWVPSLLTHANTACGLGGMIAASEDPKAAAEGYARLFAAGEVEPVEGGFKVTTGVAGGPPSAPILVLSREALAKMYPDFDLGLGPKGAFAVLRVKVEDPQTARNVLEQAGLSPVETEAGLAVGPDVACGAVVEFIPA